MWDVIDYFASLLATEKKLLLVFEVRKMWEKITKFNWGREDIVQSCGEITAKYSQSSQSLSRLKV